MGKVHQEFVGKAQADVKAWDCNEMYPEPKKMDFGPKWLGSVTKIAKQGFEVYNMVKKFIPGGSLAGAGNVPGGPDQGELLELVNIDWGQAKETAAGLGKKLLDDMEKSEKEQDDNLEKRKAIWRQALNMCETDKASFKKEL
jgi:hypothetical protein